MEPKPVVWRTMYYAMQARSNDQAARIKDLTERLAWSYVGIIVSMVAGLIVGVSL